MGRRGARDGGRRSGRLSGAPADAILSILAAQSMAVWFDPDWTPGVTLQNVAGTDRLVSLQSRPISGQTQYTVSQGTPAAGPAATLSPNGRRVMTLAAAQYLRGAGALATLLQGSASYSEIHVATKTFGGAMGRWSLGLAAAAPDNRVLHYVSAGGVTTRQRSDAGATTLNTGAAVTLGEPYVFSSTYSSAVYSGWLDAVPETLSSGGANARAPASLDDLLIGGFHSAGAAGGLWQGVQAGLIVTSPLSNGSRLALESAIGAYYGFPL